MTEHQKAIFEVLCEFDRVCQIIDVKYSLGYGTMLGAVRHQGFIPWDDDIDIIMTRKEYDKFMEKAPMHMSDKYFIQNNDTDPHYYFPFAKIRNKQIIMKEKATDYLDINHGVWIDLFPLDNVPDDQKRAVLQFNEVQKYNEKLNMMLFMYVTGHEKKYIQMMKHVLIWFGRKTYKINPFLKSLFKKREAALTKYNKTETKNVALLAFRYKGIEDYYKNYVEKDQLSNYKLMEFEGKTFPVLIDYDTLLTKLYGDYMTPPPVKLQKSVHTYAED